MTTRLQVTLEPDEHRRAKRRAAELGISLAEFVRRAVDGALDDPERAKPDISAIFGLGNSGGSNVAKFKDEYLGEAVEADYLRTKRDRLR